MRINFSKQKTLPSNPSAVATTVGWVDPVRGELLVSIKGLPGACEWNRKTNTFLKDGKVFDPLAKKTKKKAAKKRVTKASVDGKPETPISEDTQTDSKED